MNDEKVTILVNFNYQPDEEPGHMLITVAASKKNAVTECVNKAYELWKNESGASDNLEECIDAELRLAGIRYETQTFDVVDLDCTGC